MTRLPVHISAVHQILPNFSYGDAIGNDTLHLREMLRSLGCQSMIYAGVIHPYLYEEALPYREYKAVSEAGTLLIYHFSVGSELSEFVTQLPDRLIILFHNITPYRWFARVNPHLWELSAEGDDELHALAPRAAAAWADSSFNCRILESIGYSNTATLPILADLARFSIAPHPVVSAMHKVQEGPTFLFVGRVSPNKRHEDIIRIFAYYQRFIDVRARLVLAGEYQCCSKYYHALQNLIRRLRVSNVLFTGMIDFAELVAYYRMADIFLCMSEHEGFCVPLLEAFYLDVPVVAYDAAAVPETMDGAGVLLRTKDPRLVAELCHEVLHNETLRSRIISGQQLRIQRYQNFDYKGRLAQLLQLAAGDGTVARGNA